MKPWSRLCCFVLLITSTSGGQNVTDSPGDGDPDTKTEGVNAGVVERASTPVPRLDPTHHDDSSPSSPGPSSTSEAATSTDGGAEATTEATRGATRGRIPGPPVPTVAMETNGTTPSSAPSTGGHNTWGYILLVLIILVIIVLCAILYFLRRASKMYSFELQRPNPSGNLNQPTGTFEPVYLDDLDRPNVKDLTSGEDSSPPAVTNGTSLCLERRDSGENVADPQVQTNGLETSPASDGGESTAGDDPADVTTDPLSSIDLLLDPIGRQQNENNNNDPPEGAGEPFVEINLDESPWSDQLLASPRAPSSVLPFSPFSF
ncbi:unnamed protein product [Ophioblennius macclurei]